MYNIGSKLDSFLRKGCFSFVHVVLLIPLEIMRKYLAYISNFILQGLNIISKKIIIRVSSSLRQIK